MTLRALWESFISIRISINNKKYRTFKPKTKKKKKTKKKNHKIEEKKERKKKKK